MRRQPRSLLGVTDSLYGVMLLILLFILIAGCFIDGAVLIITLTPIFCRSFATSTATRCMSGWSSSSRRRSGTSRRRSGREMRRLLDPEMLDRGLHARIASATDRGVAHRAAAGVRAGDRAVRARPDLREGLSALPLGQQMPTDFR
jgi:hypothetical protein